MDNRFFSLIIVPDSGQEIKTSGFTGRFILGAFSILILTFFICLFFIIGYHIKLSQEKEYKVAVSTFHHHLKNIKQSQQLLDSLNGKLKEIQWNDWWYRLYALMKVLPDDGMYKAGIGGHVIIDESEFSDFPSDLKINLKNLFSGIAALDTRTGIQEKSLGEIRSNLAENWKIIDNTPSIIPTPTTFRITSHFGNRTHPITGRFHFHGAVDLGGRRSDPIRSTCNGVITFAQYWGNLGNCIKVENEYGYEVIYGHLHQIDVKVGDTIKKGQLIGLMGSTGQATSVHLHYSIALHGQKVDPVKFFNP